MKRGWIWIALSAAGVAVLISRRRAESALLGLPVEGSGIPKTTPHGFFGAHRVGPPVHTHQGVDLVAPPGSHVLAVGDGVIIPAEPGLGKIVRKLKLDTPLSWSDGATLIDTVVYADLGKPLVNAHERVRRGDPIATVAPAGFVHFAVKAKERFIDPKLAGFDVRSSSPAVARWPAFAGDHPFRPMAPASLIGCASCEGSMASI